MRKLIIGATGGIKVFANGSELSNVTSISFPEIELSSEEISGAGILGSIAMPTPGQFGAMTTTVSLRAAGKDKKYLLASVVNLEIRLGANFRASDGTLYVAGTRIYVRGNPIKVANGSGEIGKTRDESVDYSTTRYREVVDGEETLLIDQIAGIYRVGGENMLAGLNSALG
ncbi:Phage tail tube protein FII [Caprobacter fermentans]|uniref:Phage tail tube protein FII n=1 Tax=Caproicibacter fermentans TaxID=2576756 RepID=A0A6N8HZI2_9FIRM|nr:phage major tail tube protein [Caproicibacter fermentans]MVB11078.1 Phage tail tube protein FII [Caproicibacter fermentans]